MAPKLRFKPVSHSWVALHPQPRGVIQFVGGAFFGTFGPMLFYRHLLQYFYDRSYTLILLPFNFSFNHYREAIFLVREQYRLLPELVRMARAEHYDYQVYLKAKNYYWVGHSIGCKYISLLEGFDALPKDSPEQPGVLGQFIQDLLSNIPGEKYSKVVIDGVTAELSTLIQGLEQEAETSKRLVNRYQPADQTVQDTDPESVFADLFIKNQPSILLAPVTSDTSSAIQPKALADWIDRRGFGVQPTRAVTCALIKKSDLFNLLVLARFQSDKLAAETCDWFYNVFGRPPQTARELFLGGHLRPLGMTIGNWVVNPFLDAPWVTPVTQRNTLLESRIEQLLESLLKNVSEK